MEELTHTQTRPIQMNRVLYGFTWMDRKRSPHTHNARYVYPHSFYLCGTDHWAFLPFDRHSQLYITNSPSTAVQQFVHTLLFACREFVWILNLIIVCFGAFAMMRFQTKKQKKKKKKRNEIVSADDRSNESFVKHTFSVSPWLWLFHVFTILSLSLASYLGESLLWQQSNRIWPRAFSAPFSVTTRWTMNSCNKWLIVYRFVVFLCCDLCNARTLYRNQSSARIRKLKRKR